MSILTPRSGATVMARNPETHLVLRQPGAAETSWVQAGESGKTIEPIVSMSYGEASFLHFRLPLESGKNTFTILPAGRKVDIEFKRLQAKLKPNALDKKGLYLFHGGGDLPEVCADCHDLRRTADIEPVGLKKQVSCGTCHRNITAKGAWKHSTTVNEQCLACHQQSGDPWRIGFPTGKTEKICFACHTGKRDVFEKEFVHGPLTLGGCALCHDPHGENHRYQLWAEGSLTLCITCHGDKQGLVSKNNRVPNVHGIIFGQGCVACHDPHATDREFMIRQPTNELCVGCHPKFAQIAQGHPVARHPVSGPTENRRPGRKLTCASCHDPHGSRQQYFLIETLRGGRLCHACHDK